MLKITIISTKMSHSMSHSTSTLRNRKNRKSSSRSYRTGRCLPRNKRNKITSSILRPEGKIISSILRLEDILMIKYRRISISKSSNKRRETTSNRFNTARSLSNNSKLPTNTPNKTIQLSCLLLFLCFACLVIRIKLNIKLFYV